MPRYIDVYALKPDYIVYTDPSTSTGTVGKQYVSLVQILNAPTVEIIWCKDCKYGHELTDANGYNYRTCNNPWGHGMMVDEHGFCKWGKRREDAEIH